MTARNQYLILIIWRVRVSACGLAGNGGGGSYPCVGDADKAVSPTSGTSPGGSYPYDAGRGKEGEMGAHTSNTGMKGKVVIWKRSEGSFFSGVESGWFSCLSCFFFWLPSWMFCTWSWPRQEREGNNARGANIFQLPLQVVQVPEVITQVRVKHQQAGIFWVSHDALMAFFPGSCWVFKDEFLRWWTHSKLEARNFAVRWCKKLKFQFQWGKRNLVFFKPEWWNTNPKLSSRKLMEFGGLWRSGSYTNFQTCGPENCFWYLLIRKWYTSLKSWSRSARSNSWWSRPLRFQCTWHRTLMKVGMEGEIHAWW